MNLRRHADDAEVNSRTTPGTWLPKGQPLQAKIWSLGFGAARPIYDRLRAERRSRTMACSHCRVPSSISDKHEDSSG